MISKVHFPWILLINIGFPGVPGKFMPGDQRVNNKYTKMTVCFNIKN